VAALFLFICALVSCSYACLLPSASLMLTCLSYHRPRTYLITCSHVAVCCWWHAWLLVCHVWCPTSFLLASFFLLETLFCRFKS
jgi:hypothetical protein